MTCDAGMVPWIVNGDLIDCVTVETNTTVTFALVIAALVAGVIIGSITRY